MRATVCYSSFPTLPLLQACILMYCKTGAPVVNDMYFTMCVGELHAYTCTCTCTLCTCMTVSRRRNYSCLINSYQHGLIFLSGNLVTFGEILQYMLCQLVTLYLMQG